MYANELSILSMSSICCQMFSVGADVDAIRRAGIFAHGRCFIFLPSRGLSFGRRAAGISASGTPLEEALCWSSPRANASVPPFEAHFARMGDCCCRSLLLLFDARADRYPPPIGAGGGGGGAGGGLGAVTTAAISGGFVCCFCCWSDANCSLSFWSSFGSQSSSCRLFASEKREMRSRTPSSTTWVFPGPPAPEAVTSANCLTKPFHSPLLLIWTRFYRIRTVHHFSITQTKGFSKWVPFGFGFRISLFRLRFLLFSSFFVFRKIKRRRFRSSCPLWYL